MGIFANLDTWLIAAAIVGNTMDIGSTAAAINGGRCHEAVWPTQKVAIIGTIKGGATFTLAWGAKTNEGKLRTFMRAGLVGTAASGAIAGTLNYRRCIR